MWFPSTHGFGSRAHGFQDPVRQVDRSTPSPNRDEMDSQGAPSHSQHMRRAPKCSMCPISSTMYCNRCRDYFCSHCGPKVHSTITALKLHYPKPLVKDSCGRLRIDNSGKAPSPTTTPRKRQSCPTVPKDATPRNRVVIDRVGPSPTTRGHFRSDVAENETVLWNASRPRHETAGYGVGGRAREQTKRGFDAGRSCYISPSNHVFRSIPDFVPAYTEGRR